LQAVDCRGNIHLQSCHLEGDREPLDIDQSVNTGAFIERQTVIDCTIKNINPSGFASVKFVPNPSAPKCFLGGIKANSSIPFDSQIEQGFNIENINL